ncbi:DUF389 domain-containing protein [Candidatus Kaiserbacteria bacterium]|nr:DUF389 domain-containing protein [Candidatus Kaiserbacteria bacterium]
MPVLARFRAIPDKDKAALIRKLVQSGTPDFDYFLLIGLSTVMATLGLLLNSSSIVIGSMLIAPLIYPILGVSLGLVMMAQKTSVFSRALTTLTKSLTVGLGLSVVTAWLFGNSDMYHTLEVMARTEPSILHLLVALVAGAAATYMMARPEWSDALSGVAVAVALVPPLATIGVGIAAFDPVIIKGATMILLLNLLGIIAVAVVLFLIMNLGEKQQIAESTIKQEEKKTEQENEAIAEVAVKMSADIKPRTVIKEDITT